LIGGPELKVAKLYDMLPEEAGDTSEGRTAADNAPVRAVFFIGPDKKIKAMLTYPMTSGRNFDEVLRLLDSLQLTAAQPVATPVNWNQGDDVIIVPSVSDPQARESSRPAGRRRSLTCGSCGSRRSERGPRPWTACRATGAPPVGLAAIFRSGDLLSTAKQLLAVAELGNEHRRWRALRCLLIKSGQGK
jgi:hypothetical protein